jgi:hypothetical protein
VTFKQETTQEVADIVHMLEFTVGQRSISLLKPMTQVQRSVNKQVVCTSRFVMVMAAGINDFSICFWKTTKGGSFPIFAIAILCYSRHMCWYNLEPATSNSCTQSQ